MPYGQPLPLPKNALSAFNHVLDELHGLSSEEMMDLAEEAGVHFTTLYKWRREAPRRPQLGTFWRVMEAFGYELVFRRRIGAMRAGRKLRLVSNG
jgi:DNA-binding phage protein